MDEISSEMDSNVINNNNNNNNNNNDIYEQLHSNSKYLPEVNDETAVWWDAFKMVKNDIP